MDMSSFLTRRALRVKFSGKLGQKLEEQRLPHLRRWGALALLAAKVRDFIPLLCSPPFGSVLLASCSGSFSVSETDMHTHMIMCQMPSGFVHNIVFF